MPAIATLEHQQSFFRKIAMNPIVKPKLGILALTLELYETLAPGVRENREQWLKNDILGSLGRFVEADFQEAVYTKDKIQAEVKRFEQMDVDAIAIVFLTYAPSQIVLTTLKTTRIPLIIWNIQELFAVDGNFSQETLTQNHGVHGTQDMANVLVRCGVDFEYVTTHIDDPDGCRAVADFCIAASAKRKIAASRFGIIGNEFPGMGDFAVDTTQWVSRFGCSTVLLPMEEYITRAEHSGEAQAMELVQKYQETYLVADDVTEADLFHAAKAELALRSLRDAYQLDGMTYLFTAFGSDSRTSTVPFVAISRMMAEGFGFGGEGDLISTMATRLFYHLSPLVSFSEIFTTDYRGNALFFSHMGEANAAMARKDQKIPLVARSSPITKTLHRQLALVTVFEPGPATFVALVQGKNRWKMIVAFVRIEDFSPITSLGVPHSKVKVGDVRRFLTDYAKEGGTHHNAIGFGDLRSKLRYLAQMLDTDYVDIT